MVENNPIKVDDYESMDEVQTIIQLVGEAEEARDEAVSAAETAAHDAVVEVAALYARKSAVGGEIWYLQPVVAVGVAPRC